MKGMVPCGMNAPQWWLSQGGIEQQAEGEMLLAAWLSNEMGRKSLAPGALAVPGFVL